MTPQFAACPVFVLTGWPASKSLVPCQSFRNLFRLPGRAFALKACAQDEQQKTARCGIIPLGLWIKIAERMDVLIAMKVGDALTSFYSPRMATSSATSNPAFTIFWWSTFKGNSTSFVIPMVQLQNGQRRGLATCGKLHPNTQRPVAVFPLMTSWENKRSCGFCVI